LVTQATQLLLAVLHFDVDPVQQLVPQAVPPQAVQVPPEQMSLALAQQTVLAPLPHVLVVQLQVPGLEHVGVAPEQQVVPQAVPLQVAQVVPLQYCEPVQHDAPPQVVPLQATQAPPVQYCPLGHEVDVHWQVWLMVLQLGVVPVQLAVLPLTH
jgi:hypothetical protein